MKKDWYGQSEISKELKKEMTPQESQLWHQFLKDYPVRITRQKIINRFVVDFYCSRAKLIIEINGAQQDMFGNAVYDAKRVKILKGYGLNCIHFNNQEIEDDFESVCQKIGQTIKSKIPE